MVRYIVTLQIQKMYITYILKSEVLIITFKPSYLENILQQRLLVVL